MDLWGAGEEEGDREGSIGARMRISLGREREGREQRHADAGRVWREGEALNG